jgi:hypothetical protein
MWIGYRATRARQRNFHAVSLSAKFLSEEVENDFGALHAMQW